MCLVLEYATKIDRSVDKDGFYVKNNRLTLLGRTYLPVVRATRLSPRFVL